MQMGMQMSREGSGTSWLPDSTPMYALHWRRGPWQLMAHENAFVQVLHELPQTLVILNKNSQRAVSDEICRAELIRALVLANTTSTYPAAALTTWEQRINAVEAGGMAAVADTVNAVANVDWLTQLGAITAPTLIIAGALDLGAPPATSQAMHAAIPGSRLVVLAEASHLSVAEQPAEFAALVRGFITQ